MLGVGKTTHVFQKISVPNPNKSESDNHLKIGHNWIKIIEDRIHDQ